MEQATQTPLSAQDEEHAHKERPINLTTEQVRATLEGRMTQMRRAMEPQVKTRRSILTGCNDYYWKEMLFESVCADESFNISTKIIDCEDNRPDCRDCYNFILDCSPYGVVGDRLWVREKWLPSLHGDVPVITFPTNVSNSPAGDYLCVALEHADAVYDLVNSANEWRTPIYMPRWASRLTLEITEIRVERLQDITDADAIAEGCEDPTSEHISIAPGFMREVFKGGWDYLNAKRGFGWDANPFVWAISFKVIAAKGESK
jgi:hypothetical protein